MDDHFRYGGGAGQTTMPPVVMVATLLAAVAVLFLPRKYALAPILAVTFLTPFGQQILAGGFHFFAIRIIILAGALRMIWVKLSSQTALFGNGLGILDTTFCLWALFRALTFIVLFRDGAAVTNQAAFCLDAFGGYFLFRYLLQNEEDIFRAAKCLVVVATILAMCMGYEYLTRVNVFNIFRDVPIVPWIREGRVRAQAVFANSITAGSFGATTLPLFFWLWKSGKARAQGAIGLLAATTIVMCSVAGTPATTFLASIGALSLWPIRKRMIELRWGLVVTLLCLALVMKAPVWFVIAHVDFVGGAHAWDRAALIDQFVRHFSDWWLLGTAGSASWGADTWDACNQFVAEGTEGGLVSLILFILILSRGFGMIGRARKAVEGDRRQEWFLWCLGCSFFAHVMTFWGIDYFDQMSVWWYATLAMIPAATAAYAGVIASPPQKSEVDLEGTASTYIIESASGKADNEFGY